jgi:formiminotetrahydrofolate cyclodeaminase
MSPEGSLSSRSLVELLDAFASSAPVPGGGSAAALTGATGVALLIMVAGLSKTRTGTSSESLELAAAAERLRPLRETLTALVDRDAEAYTSVMDARRLPKTNDDQVVRRRQAIASAMLRATETPLDTMRACRHALADALIVASLGAPSASSDVGVAIELLRAAGRGAAMNVDTNLPSLKDTTYADRVRAEREQLDAESTAAVERALALLARSPSGF